MVIKNIFNTCLPYISVLNSVYLSYVYFEAFMLDRYNEGMTDNFNLPFYTTPFIMLILIQINSIKNLFNEKKYQKTTFYILSLISILFCSLFIFSFGLLIYKILIKNNLSSLFFTSFSIFFEIINIVISVGRAKRNRTYKVLGVYLVWAFIIMLGFSVSGFFAEHLGYKKLDESNVKIIFTGIFYHLLSASFLFYSYLPRWPGCNSVRFRL
jgi:hypothetical protein